MLSALIAAALLTSSSAVSLGSSKIQAAGAKVHEKVSSRFSALRAKDKMVAAPAGLKLNADSMVGYAQMYTDDEFTTCADSEPSYYSYYKFGYCYELGGYGIWENIVAVDTMYNYTVNYWTSTTCEGDAFYVAQGLMAGTCDEAVTMGDDDQSAVDYVMGTSSSYTAKNWGYQNYDTSANCDAGTDVTSAVEYWFGECTDLFGAVYLTVDNCNSATMYSDSDCTEAIADDDDFYADDADDDGMSCFANGDGYTTLYCTGGSSSASSYATPSAFAMIAATVAAVVAMM